jgi:hypothetical protein
MHVTPGRAGENGASIVSRSAEMRLAGRRL